MDIFELLKTEHQKVSVILRKLTAVRHLETRETLFSQLKEQLHTHTHIEKSIFYPALNGDERVEKDSNELESMQQLLSELNGLPLEGRAWKIKLFELKAKFLRHIEHQEDGIFTNAHQILDDRKISELSRKAKKESL